MRNEEDWFDVRPPVIDTHPPILGIGDEDGIGPLFFISCGEFTGP